MVQKFVIDEIHSRMDKTNLSWDDVVESYICSGIGAKKVDCLIEEIVTWFNLATKEDLK